MKRILFVDDDLSLLEGLRRMLRPAGVRWEMQFVTSGPEALQACQERRFDVVVSDLRMPGMNGAELLEQIQERYPGTGRVILSGYSEAGLAAAAARVAHCVLSKPCSASELQTTIDRAAG